ncbi:MAG TPA: LysR family transcriptional regulator, partial [Syntrophomonadaceae bacterium]|nr:LysR family transcriptional regulator [Syntrophomonadaceae bacterium]
MELKLIKYFCLVAETENVTSAAQLIGISQPYLSKKIKQLEGKLGINLFDHVGRNIKLNQYGEIYYK